MGWKEAIEPVKSKSVTPDKNGVKKDRKATTILTEPTMENTACKSNIYGDLVTQKCNRGYFQFATPPAKKICIDA